MTHVYAETLTFPVFYCNAHAHASVELAHITDEVRLLLTATTAAYYIVYLPDFVR